MTAPVTKMSKRENLLRTIRGDAPAYVPYRYDGCLTILKPIITARPRAGGIDDWGVRWIASGTDEGSYPDTTAVITLEEAPKLPAPAPHFSGRPEEDPA